MEIACEWGERFASRKLTLYHNSFVNVRCFVVSSTCRREILGRGGGVVGIPIVRADIPPHIQVYTHTHTQTHT